jgi:thiol-disulfide isomerase/thioredoxin
MQELNSVEDIDTYVTKNPNSVVVVYKKSCPWCQKMIEDLKKLEEKGLANVYLLPEDKGASLVKNLGGSGVPFTIAFKECSVEHVFNGYDKTIAPTLEMEYAHAEPVCRVNLSEVLFKNTLLGEPIL